MKSLCQISLGLFIFLIFIEFSSLQNTNIRNRNMDFTQSYFPEIFEYGESTSEDLINITSSFLAVISALDQPQMTILNNELATWLTSNRHTQPIFIFNIAPTPSTNELVASLQALLLDISRFFRHTPKSFWKPCFILQVGNLDTSTISSILQQLEALLSSRRFRNLSNSTANANPPLLRVNFPYNSDIYVVFQSKSNEKQVWEIYSAKRTNVIQNLNYAETVLGSNLLDPYQTLVKDVRRANLRRETLVAVSMDVQGYELATNFMDNSSEDIFVGGFEVLFYRYLQDAMNFTEKALKGLGYVREGPNGTLLGMAVQINTGLADICISSTEFLEYRVSGADGLSYLLPSFKLGMQAYFKQPPASSIRDVFISAFSLQLWILLFALWVLICIIMSVAYYLYFKQSQYSSSSGSVGFSTFSKKALDKHPFNMEMEQVHLSWRDKRMSQEIGIWAAGAVCQQGWYYTPDGIPTRIIFFFGWFTGFICYIAFSAQLVSILSVEVVPINSFEDLLRDNFFIYSDNHIPTTKYYVKGLQTRGIIPVLPEEMRNIDIEMNIDKITKRRGAMVSISDSFFPILEKIGLSESYICSTLSEIRVGTRSVIMSMFVKRDNPMRGIFNMQILRMVERGINSRLLREYLKKTSVRCLKDGSGLDITLGPKDLFTAYALLLSGFVFSTVLLIVEQLFRRIISSRQNAVQKLPLSTSTSTSSVNSIEELKQAMKTGYPSLTSMSNSSSVQSHLEANTNIYPSKENHHKSAWKKIKKRPIEINS